MHFKLFMINHILQGRQTGVLKRHIYIISLKHFI